MKYIKFCHELGFLRNPTETNCDRDLLLALPADALENAIRKWAGNVIEEDAGGLRPVAIEGKTLCKTMQPHGQSIHLLAMLGHATGGVLARADTARGNEHKAALKLLRSIAFGGKMITGDAMFCLRDPCRHITDSGDHYLFTVKDSQPSLLKTIQSDFNLGLSLWSERVRREQHDQHRQVDAGTGASRTACIGSTT